MSSPPKPFSISYARTRSSHDVLRITSLPSKTYLHSTDKLGWKTEQARHGCAHLQLRRQYEVKVSLGYTRPICLDNKTMPPPTHTHTTENRKGCSQPLPRIHWTLLYSIQNRKRTAEAWCTGKDQSTAALRTLQVCPLPPGLSILGRDPCSCTAALSKLIRVLVTEWGESCPSLSFSFIFLY